MSATTVILICLAFFLFRLLGRVDALEKDVLKLTSNVETVLDVLKSAHEDIDTTEAE